MPTLEDHAVELRIKLLLYGDSGSGKTGSLAALANEGHRLVIADYDNGLDILHAFVKPEFRKNIYYVTLTDKLRGSSMGPLPAGTPTAITKGMKLLDNWTDGETKLGAITSWTRDTTFVTDSLTLMGDAALRYIRFINGRGPEDPTWQSDWGQAMGMQEGYLELLFSDAVKCNVIVTSHIVMLGGDEKTGVGAKGHPTALGRKLPPRVPRWFNNSLRAVTAGGGRRVFRTVSTDELELKNVRPKDVPRELPIDTGLADFYKIISGEVKKYEPSE